MADPVARNSKKLAGTVARDSSGPEFVRYFGPLLEALRELGDSARPKEATALIAKNLKLSDQKLDETIRSGASRYQNQIYWARFYLAKAGLIDSTQRGVWTLTEKGRNTLLDLSSSRAIFQQIQSGFEDESGKQVEDDASAPPEDAGMSLESQAGAINFSDELAATLRRLTPEGFEKLCKLILRNIGFEEVEVIGRSGDGGIDGIGTLRINRLLTDRVVFQCKRYSSPVAPTHIRDFRGAMQGRADRGIFLSTGTFSADARREASREGASRIELVDISGLVGLLRELKLGISEQVIYVVNKEFFHEFGMK